MVEMWKDTELCSKRDDDSAIGDSANNSAGEESTNSRRKSPALDDIDDLHLEPQAQLASKLGKDIPHCLLKDAEESLENCKSISRSSINKKSKTKRIIRIIPASAALAKKPSEPRKSQPTEQPNMNVLNSKLQHLFFEMKKLRELDRDILRKFMDINESVEEVRWKIAENEATLKQNLVDDDVEDDVMLALSESKINGWGEMDYAETQNEEDLKFIVPVTKVSTSYASVKDNKRTKSMTSSVSTSSESSSTVTSKSVHRQISQDSDVTPKQTRSKSVATMNHSNERKSRTNSQSQHAVQTAQQHGHSPVKAIEMEKLRSTNYYRLTSPHPSPTGSHNTAPASDVWVKKDDFNVTSNSARSSSQPTKLSHRQKSSSKVPTKYTERIQQQNVRRNPKSFKMVSDEKSQVGHRSHWSTKGKKEERGAADFQKQRDYKNLIGLSRVSGHSVQQSRRKSYTKPSDSAGSLHSSSSLTSSGSSSSSSVTSPLRNNGSNGKWSRFGLKRSSKSLDINNFNNNSGVVIVNSNYKPNGSSPDRSNNVVAVSYKQRTSENIYSWMQSQDDITYL